MMDILTDKEKFVLDVYCARRIMGSGESTALQEAIHEADFVWKELETYLGRRLTELVDR